MRWAASTIESWDRLTGFAKALIRSSSLLSSALLLGQLTTGTLEIHTRPGITITVRGQPGSSVEVQSDTHGECKVVLPYGKYQITAEGTTTEVYVAPLAVTPVTPRRKPDYFGSPSLHGMLLALDPATVTEPLDFTGLASMRLPLVSRRAYSWTDTQYTLAGLNATDAWQPGHPAIFPDVQALTEVVVRDSQISLFLPEPDRVWHAELSSACTGSTASNAAERFHWFTRDNLQAGGPLGRRADLFLSGTGQWASQTVPQPEAGPDLRSRMLYGNARGRVALTERDQLEAHFSGSQIHLSNWGIPAGLEALLARRMSPELNLPWGFADLEENDHLDSVQAGWTHQTARGALQVRYGFSPTHLDTLSRANGPSQIELAGDAVTGAPPLANLAVRVRNQIAAAFETTLRAHHIAAGADWSTAKIRNRFTVPGGRQRITADGAPAFLVDFNPPVDARANVRAAALYLRDHISLASWLTLDAAIAGDFSRGTSIAWNSASPSAGLAISPPMLRRLILRAGYSRPYVPLAGRYLDFGNPNSLGGSEYQWRSDGRRGPLLARFGGPYSAIDPHLLRPYADEFNLGAEAGLPLHTFASIRLFRRDDKRRLAAIDTGVPPEAYRAIPIQDPGPDSIAGTFDDQTLTVYAQDPATFGKDQYLLTNPPGLRALHEGVVAEAGGQWRAIDAHASFMTVKAWGPTNPGNSPLENDPGVIGSLLADPNTAIHASGRGYFDRAFVGKVQLTARLPRQFGGIEIANTANYLDGLVFARQLLVTGLPQGPLLVAATVRGSPEGGNRSEFVINWNLRLARTFALPRGSLRLALDILNVTDANNRLQESDRSGPRFNLRLPTEIEAPRFLRFDLKYRF